MASIRYCQQQKDLEVHAWCLMTSHMHMIIGTKGNPLSNIMRDLKRHSSEKLHEAIKHNFTESRSEWMLEIFTKAGKAHGHKFQLWQLESHPIELTTAEMANQKLEYIHYNPVASGFVTREKDWLYSSAIDYNGGKGILEIIQLEPLMPQ